MHPPGVPNPALVLERGGEVPMGLSNPQCFSSEEGPQGTQSSSKGKQKALKLHYFFKHNDAFLVIMQMVRSVRSGEWQKNTRPLKQI